jgi:hypothetical protein
MLTLKINGEEEKISIGCRTFVSLYELLHLLEIPSGTDLTIKINKQNIEPHEYMLQNVSSSDRLTIESSAKR